MAFPYTDVNDASQHLLGTVVLYDGNPVVVMGIINDINGFEAQLVPCHPRGSDQFRVSLWDPKIKTRNFNLGYVNFGKSPGAVFLTRQPRRQYQQGLSDNNVVVSTGDRFSHIRTSKNFVDAMRGIYPSINDCIKRLQNGDCTSIAFNTEFALADNGESGIIRLMYREVEVGVVVNNTIFLGDQHKWLNKHIQKYVTELNHV
jgi:hypothetical protein